MKKALFAIAFVLSVVLSFHVPALSQGRLDIALEGPWIFYQEDRFNLTDGVTITHHPALIAVAPKVPGHYPLVFSSGNGLSYPQTGVYCVGFDQACMASLPENTQIINDNYPGQQFVRITKPAGGWGWTSIPAARAYVLIIPLPYSWSSDGKYVYNIMSTFPSDTNTPLPTGIPPTTIGMQLHYTFNSGSVTTFNLSTCTQSSSSVFQCRALNGQANSGTLRISIKSPDDLPNQLQCDHHVHRAYHYMAKLIDLHTDPQVAYLLDPATYREECRRCDPQLENTPEDCSAGPHVMMIPTVEDLLTGLDEVINQLGALQSEDAKCRYELCDLQEQRKEVASPSASLNTLLYIENSLEKSQVCLADDLESATKAEKKKKDGCVSASDGVAKTAQAKSEARFKALGLEKRLMPTVIYEVSSATNGKDCRAPAMRVQ